MDRLATSLVGCRAAFAAGFVVFGITYSFGVFLEPITADFQISRAATSGLFSISRYSPLSRTATATT
jgi:hypothetical protein